jgi:hypothetical protein
MPDGAEVVARRAENGRAGGFARGSIGCLACCFDRGSAGQVHAILVCTPSPTLFVGEGGTRVSVAG